MSTSTINFALPTLGTRVRLIGGGSHDAIDAGKVIGFGHAYAGSYEEYESGDIIPARMEPMVLVEIDHPIWGGPDREVCVNVLPCHPHNLEVLP